MIMTHLQLWKGRDNTFMIETQLGLLNQIASGRPVFHVINPASTSQIDAAFSQVQNIHNRSGFDLHSGVFNHEGFQYLFGLQDILIISDSNINFDSPGVCEVVVDDEIIKDLGIGDKNRLSVKGLHTSVYDGCGLYFSQEISDLNGIANLEGKRRN